jgi:hypothetical protein
MCEGYTGPTGRAHVPSGGARTSVRLATRLPRPAMVGDLGSLAALGMRGVSFRERRHEGTRAAGRPEGLSYSRPG